MCAQFKIDFLDKIDSISNIEIEVCSTRMETKYLLILIVKF